MSEKARRLLQSQTKSLDCTCHAKWIVKKEGTDRIHLKVINKSGKKSGQLGMVQNRVNIVESTIFILGQWNDRICFTQANFKLLAHFLEEVVIQRSTLFSLC